MTERHPTPARIHDWADGLLAPDEGTRMREHLEGCPACAAEAAALHDLRDALASLPADLDPGEDLRPGIRALRQARGEVRGRRGLRGGVLAAAAIVVLALGTAAILAVRGSVPGNPTGAAPVAEAPSTPGADDAAAVVLALDREYERAGDELKARMERGMPGLSAEAAQLLSEEIAAVETALETTRAALHEDPDSPVLRELVLVAHRQRMDVLRRGVALATEMEAA